MLNEVGVLGHLTAAVGFALLGAAALVQGARGRANLWLAIAAFGTSGWASCVALAGRFGPPWLGLIEEAETLRSAGWLALLLFMLGGTAEGWSRRRIASSAALASLVLLQLLLAQAPAADARNLLDFTRIAVAISGLVLVHNLYANSTSPQLWLRLFAVAVGGIFAYDLNLHTLAFLLGQPSEGLTNIRGAAETLVVPLLLIATRERWASRLRLSHEVAFRSLSFGLIGGYLILMSLLAYGLRLTGGDWGLLLQVCFLVASAIAGALVALSRRTRARLRVLIARNFLTYRYDYRQEWLRFINTLSRAEDGAPAGAGAVRDRVIRAIAAVLDSPGGLLLEPSDDEFTVSAIWNWRRIEPPTLSVDDPLIRRLEERRRVIDFDSGGDGLTPEEEAAGATQAEAILPPAFVAGTDAWLAVPLLHLDRLAGVLVLRRSIAERDLNWEDYDLLRLLGRQAASYIAEAASQAALDEAQKFDEFNRRFAFIMHDVKNLVSQLGLLARNAERHADNPAFRADMVATLKGSVTKMNDLLALLGPQAARRAEPTRETIGLAPMLERVVASCRRRYTAIDYRLIVREATVAADPVRLEQAFVHLLNNAVDASHDGLPVTVTLGARGAEAVVSIADLGRGMSPAFVRNELFAPFRSTKAGGFGIGVYDARETVRAAGGSIQVASREGEGTTFTVRLPLVAAPAAAAADRGGWKAA